MAWMSAFVRGAANERRPTAPTGIESRVKHRVRLFIAYLTTSVQNNSPRQAFFKDRSESVGQYCSITVCNSSSNCLDTSSDDSLSMGHRAGLSSSVAMFARTASVLLLLVGFSELSLGINEGCAGELVNVGLQKGGRDRVSFLASLFVGRPQVIAVAAGLFLLAYYVMRLRGTDKSGQPRFLLMLALAWGLYAAWEAAVLFFTPEANIRVDLLLIWPVLGLFSIWAVYRALR